jgi:mRNA interferase MazF
MQVVPLTSNVGRLYPSEARVRLGGGQRKAMADQLTTISKLRLRDRAGRLGAQDMAAVEQAICLQLGL